MVGSVGLDSTSFASAQAKDIDQALLGLEQEKYDLIAVGRALLADAEWLPKMQAGDLNKVRPFSKDMLKKLD